MNRKDSIVLIIVIFAIIAAGVLVWGFVGGNEAKDAGVTCDMGAGESLCWQWHKNILGQAQEAFKDNFGK